MIGLVGRCCRAIGLKLTPINTHRRREVDMIELDVTERLRDPKIEDNVHCREKREGESRGRSVIWKKEERILKSRLSMSTRHTNLVLQLVSLVQFHSLNRPQEPLW